jgi:hypothetical protein
MTTKEIYESIDQSKISKEGKKFLMDVEEGTKGFTKQNDKVDKALLNLYKKLKEKKPEALKNLKTKTVEKSVSVPTTKAERKKEPKKETKKVTKKVVEASGTKKNTKPTKTPSTPKVGKQEHISTRASKLAKKEGITFKQARAKLSKEAKEDFKKEKKEADSELDKLLKFVRKGKFEDGEKYPKIYGKQDKGKSSVSADAKRMAKPVGKRVSKNGKTYYEYRDNRSDRNSLPAPKGQYKYKGETPPFLEAGGTLPTPFGQAGLVGETGTLNEVDLFAMGGGLPQGVHQFYGETYNPAYPTPHGYAKGGKTDDFNIEYLKKLKGEGAIKKHLNSLSNEDIKRFNSIHNVNNYKGGIRTIMSTIIDKDIQKNKDILDMLAKGGALKGSNRSTGESYGVVVGSKEVMEDGDVFINVRTGYNSRISESKLKFNNGNIEEITDYGYTLDGSMPDLSAGSGKGYNATTKAETIKVLSKLYNPSFAKKLIEYSKEKFADGGKTQGYNDRLDESLGNRNSVEPLMMQSYTDRRDESKGMEKSMGRRAYQSVGSMDKMAKGGRLSTSDRYVLELAGLTGLRKNAIEELVKDNSLTESELLNIIVGVGRQQIKSSVVVSAVMGGVKSKSNTDLVKFAKSEKAMRLAKGGEIDAFIMKFVKDAPASNLRVDAEELTAKLKKGGKLGFDGLANKVAKRYVGKPVKGKFQSEYGKTYSKAEAMEVGKKVAGKVYRQQQGMEAGGTLPTPFGQAGLVGETGTLNEVDLFAMGGGLPQGVQQYYANTYNPAYPTPHGYAKGGEIEPKNDSPFSVEVWKTKARYNSNVASLDKMVSTYSDALELSLSSIDDGAYKSQIMSKEGYLWEVDKDGVQSYAKGGKLDLDAYYSKMVDKLGKEGTFIRILKDSQFDKARIENEYRYSRNGKYMSAYVTDEQVNFYGMVNETFTSPKKLAEYLDKNQIFAKGGKTQGYNDKLDESLGNTKGKRSTKEQNYKDRRNESEAMEDKGGKRKYSRVNTMDKMAKGGTIIKKGNRVRVVNTQFDGKEGLVVSNDLQNGNYQVQMQDGKTKGFPFENLMLLSRETYAKGGKTQGYNDKLDESLGNTKGKRSTKEQNYKDRRNESEAMEKKGGKRKYASVKTMDKGNRSKRKTPMSLAKEIRKEGEKWQDAVKRASAMLKKV